MGCEMTREFDVYEEKLVDQIVKCRGLDKTGWIFTDISSSTVTHADMVTDPKQL